MREPAQGAMYQMVFVVCSSRATNTWTAMPGMRLRTYHRLVFLMFFVVTTQDFVYRRHVWLGTGTHAAVDIGVLNTAWSSASTVNNEGRIVGGASQPLFDARDRE